MAARLHTHASRHPPAPAPKGSQLKRLSLGQGQSLLQTPHDGGYQGMEVTPMVLRNFFLLQSSKQPKLPAPLYSICRICSHLQPSPARSGFAWLPDPREGLQPLQHPQLIYL